MKRLITTAALTLGLGLNAQAILLYSTDFTNPPDSFTNGGGVGADANWNAQPAWTTSDVTGAGYANVSTDFSRAINTGGGTTLAVGQSVTLTLNLNVLGTWNVDSGNNDLLAVGLTESFDSGAAVTRVGAGIRANTFADTLNLRNQVFDTNPQVAAFDWSGINDGSASVSDNLSWVVTITKTGTADTFDVSTTITDTEGANQESGIHAFSIVSSELYAAGALYPIVRAGGQPSGNGITGIQVNNFSASNSVIPEPSTVALFMVAGAMMWVRRFRLNR